MAHPSMDAAAGVREDLEAHPDLLRGMLQTMAEALMSAEVNALCGAEYGERSPERVNSRNGYRMRDWDTRAGSLELAIPRLRQGSYFPDWLLEPRRRAGGALVHGGGDGHLAGGLTRGGGGPGWGMGLEGVTEVHGSGMVPAPG